MMPGWRGFFERATVSEQDHTEELVEVRKLWSVSFRKGDDDTWVDQGMPSSDLAAILRTLDYLEEHFPGTENRILETNVTVKVADVDRLREKVSQAAAAAAGAGVHSG